MGGAESAREVSVEREGGGRRGARVGGEEEEG
jgi:hypothetical protein